MDSDMQEHWGMASEIYLGGTHVVVQNLTL